MTVFLVSGDNRRTLRALEANSIDAVVCDPPYGLGREPDMTEVLTHWLRGDDYTASGGGFMGKTWDSFVPGPATWKEVYRVIKPGGHVIMFSGTRTWDIATLALRLAGFEIRDGLMWLYGSGFPKSMNVSQAIDKAAGATREKVPIGSPVKRMIPGNDQNVTGSWIKDNGREYQPGVEIPATDDAARWDGWGTALKPAWEPIVLARKPFRGTVADNVLAHGTGALNIDATRISTTDKLGGGAEGETRPDQKATDAFTRPWMEDPDAQSAHAERVRANVQRAEVLGRFPANVLLSHTDTCIQTGTTKIKAITGTNSGRGSGKYADDSNVYGTYAGRTDMDQGAQVGLGDADGMETIEVWECAEDCPVKMLDGQSGITKSTGGRTIMRSGGGNVGSGKASEGMVLQADPGFGDLGGASRFFYCAKTAKLERNAGMPPGTVNDHPTVKPIALMGYLIKLVTPPGGTVLDPFMGSGSTGIAAVHHGYRFIGLDDDPIAVAIARHRISFWGHEVEVLGPVADDSELKEAK